eukprot:1416748-Pyramimonas_sp.AAC.1
MTRKAFFSSSVKSKNVHPSVASMENSLEPGARRGRDATSPAQVDGLVCPTGGKRGTWCNCCVRKT